MRGISSPVDHRAAVVDCDPLEPVVQPCLWEVVPHLRQLVPAEDVLLVGAVEAPLVREGGLAAHLHLELRKKMYMIMFAISRENIYSTIHRRKEGSSLML